jgi:glycosyltransferase involved in cell wall biosynthesis
MMQMNVVNSALSVASRTNGGDDIQQGHQKKIEIAVLLPCYNEEAAIEKVVSDFRLACPAARIYVYDNNSTDMTSLRAREAGAIVRAEQQQGKGNVVRRMFADIDADVYVMVDGDGTYDASVAPELIDKLLAENLDFINGSRVSTDQLAYRRGHRFGNVMLTSLVRNIFGRQFNDMLSGYKVLSRRFVKSFPAMSRGFEIETEIAVHALEMRVPCAEIATKYNARMEGSQSKLRTYRDGYKILMLIARLIKDERPFQFFGLAGLLLGFIAIWLSIPILQEYLSSGTVPRLPTAVLCVGLMICGTFSVSIGLILEMVSRTRLEMKRLCYLQSR